MRVLVAVVIVPLMWVGAPGTEAASPSSSDKRKAGAYYMEGERLFKDELYSAAIENFKKAHAIIPVPANLYNIARAYEKLGDAENCVKGYEEYRTFYQSKNRGKEPPDIVDVRASIQKCRLLMRPEVTVGSEPFGAKVYIDDKTKLLGQTPYKTTLDPGSYELILDLEGYQPFEEQFEVRAGEPIKLFFKLEKFQRVGTIKLRSNVRGAQVFLDGKNVGLTPYDEAITLDEGQHQITVDKDEYIPFKRELQVEANQVYEIDSAIYLRDPPTTWKAYVGWTSLVLGVGAGVAGFFAGDHADTFFKGTDDFDKYSNLQTISYAVGGTLAGAGIVLIVLEALDDKLIKEGDAIEARWNGEPQLTPYVGVDLDGNGMVGADVRF